MVIVKFCENRSTYISYNEYFVTLPVKDKSMSHQARINSNLFRLLISHMSFKSVSENRCGFHHFYHYSF